MEQEFWRYHTNIDRWPQRNFYYVGWQNEKVRKFLTSLNNEPVLTQWNCNRDISNVWNLKSKEKKSQLQKRRGETSLATCWVLCQDIQYDSMGCWDSYCWPQEKDTLQKTDEHCWLKCILNIVLLDTYVPRGQHNVKLFKNRATRMEIGLMCTSCVYIYVCI